MMFITSYMLSLPTPASLLTPSRESALMLSLFGQSHSFKYVVLVNVSADSEINQGPENANYPFLDVR